MGFDYIICEDCLKVFPNIPDKSIDLICTDPPYWGMKQELYDNSIQTIDQYLKWYEEWLVEAQRVLSEKGSMYVFIPPLEFAEIHLLIKKYFRQKQVISWIKPNVMIRQPTTRNYLPKVEFVGFYVKDPENYTWNSLVKRYGLQKSCNFDIEATIYRYMMEGRNHPTQKPEKLIGKFIYASSNERDVVLDPFCGSGTVPAVAKVLNRKFIGIEIDQRYVKMSNNRIGNTSLQDIFDSKPKGTFF